MNSSRHPAFAKLVSKIERARDELRETERFAADNAGAIERGEWAALGALSLGVHNVYSGMEDILLNIANDVDGYVPQGPSQHQDLLDQMSVAIDGTRPAVIDHPLYNALTELKGFRHLVRHRYGLDLEARKVRDNVERASAALPAFVQAITRLERFLLSDGRS